MFVTEQLVDFLQFIVIGVVLAVLFDFFRAYRKLKKVSTFKVVIQDIIYFVIATVIVVLGVIFILDSNIRLHIFIALIIGFMLYVSLLSKYIMKFCILFFNTFHVVVDTLFTPINLMLQILHKICNILKKIMKKCCKKFSVVLSFLHKIVNKAKTWFKSIFSIKKFKNKRGLKKYEKSC